MDLLTDAITYVRRIIKSPSDADISDSLIVDYINRFWINDVDARIQLFDLKTKYQFQTVPGVDQYNMPLYDIQQSVASTPQTAISFYPVYQGFLGPAYVNGVEVSFYTSKGDFFRAFPNVVQPYNQVDTGDGGTGPYNFRIPLLGPQPTPLNPPINAILRGHVDITGIIATGSNQDPIQVSTLNLNVPTANAFPSVYFTTTLDDGSNNVICDSGQFLLGALNYGLMMSPGTYPNGNTALLGGYSIARNTFNYLTGEANNVFFPVAVPEGAAINAQCHFFQTGLPRAILFNNNVLCLRNVPDRQYLVEIDAYLSPAAFLATANRIQFGYMTEYIARGAARKILSDTGDIEQLNFYEPLFKEQEMLVWKRSQRQFTSTRVQTIYSTGPYAGQVAPTGMNATTL